MHNINYVRIIQNHANQTLKYDKIAIFKLNMDGYGDI